MKILKTTIHPKSAIIGDIHQCNSMLIKMIDTCKEVGVKNFIFLGDILDRGPDPIGTVETLLSIKDNSIFLVGNHDWKIIRYADKRGVRLSEEQANNVELFKEKNLFDSYINLFSQEWVALFDEDQKVMCSHAPGYNPEKLVERYKNNDLGKNQFPLLLYGRATGDTLNGLPIRMPLTESATDTLGGWELFHGHVHGGRLYTEASSHVKNLDMCPGQPNGRIGCWVIEDTVRNGKLLIIDAQGQVAWNPEKDMLPYEPSSH